MSVAFRRESDEEHLEPKFEIPIPTGPNLVSQRGLTQLREKVAALEGLLPSVTAEDAVKDARRQLRYWRTRLATARLAPEPSGDTVEFGCTVHYRLNGRDRSIGIVGDDEADPAADLIAFSAPLARAMMGAEVGEFLAFQGKADAIEVLSITPRA